MVSDFRTKKFEHIFYSFFDVNKDGVIEKKDFDLALEKIAKLRGWKDGDVTYELTKDLLSTIWAGLQQAADSDNDGQVTVQEWISLWDKYAQNPDAAAEWQTLFCRALFQLVDTGNDAAVDCDEFTSVFATFGLDKEESISAFQKVAQGEDKVTLAVFEGLWRQYFCSEDPAECGNFIFGIIH